MRKYFFSLNQNSSPRDEDAVLARGSGGVAPGMFWQYWAALLEPVDKHPIGGETRFFSRFSLRNIFFPCSDSIDGRPWVVEKLVIVPRTCHFDLPPTWRHLTRGDVDPGCDDQQQQQQVCEFGIRQNRVHEHNRTKPIRKDVFRLTRERDGKSYDVVYDFPFILKSTLGNVYFQNQLFFYRSCYCSKQDRRRVWARSTGGRRWRPF